MSPSLHNSRIGFMQGRLLPPIGGAIQAFPLTTWESEFPIACNYGFAIMEWVLHPEGYDRNPLLSSEGRRRIRTASQANGVAIQSCTSDTAMLWAFHKADGIEAERRLDILRREVVACAEAGIAYIVVPLVDQGSVDNEQEKDRLLKGLHRLLPMLSTDGCSVLFESDLPPLRLGAFIDALPTDCFGINYDIGNSASLGYDPVAEVAIYGGRIRNVHVKDRRLGGMTVPLGEGAARLAEAIASLEIGGYAGAYILQTARNPDGHDVEVACRYRDMTARWISSAGR